MDVTRPREISELLRTYGISVRKSWGQNFLVNKAAVERILEAAALTGSETVLEIGPGLGVMTSGLLQSAGKVAAIEIDPLLCQVLQDRFGHLDNFHLVQGDALEQDLSTLVTAPYIVVANLPYYITTPLLIKLLEHEFSPRAAVVLVQWEVARRLTASPGTSDYGALSVLVQYHTQPDLLYKIGAGSFYPPPKVDSAVVKMTWRPPARRPNNEMLMFKIVRAAFGQRRKMLKGLLAREFMLETEKIAGIMEQLGFNGDVRGERLSVLDFAALADSVEELI